jgi:hypothetical protein
MLRCSSLHTILSNRPTFDVENHNKKIDTLTELWLKTFPEQELDLAIALETRGLVTAAKAVQASFENQNKFLNSDSLGDAHKNAIKKIWLENNTPLYSVSGDIGSMPQILKGNYWEDYAIEKVLSEYYGQALTNNKERRSLGFLTGECDIYTILDGNPVVIDNKIPKDYISFKSKEGIEPVYLAQLLGYAILWNVREVRICYVLCPDVLTGHEYTDTKIDASNEFIENLDVVSRVKEVKHRFTEDDIAFALSRIAMAKDYYESLDLKTALNNQIHV